MSLREATGWRPPGSGIRSSTLGTKRLGTPQVQLDGAIGSKRAIRLGKGIQVKGSSAQSMRRGSRLQASASGRDRDAGGEAQRAVRVEAQQAAQMPKAKRGREESAGENGARAKRACLRSAGRADPCHAVPQGEAGAPGAIRSSIDETLWRSEESPCTGSPSPRSVSV